MVVPVLMTNCQVSLKPKMRTRDRPHQNDQDGDDERTCLAADARGLFGEDRESPSQLMPRCDFSLSVAFAAVASCFHPCCANDL